MELAMSLMNMRNKIGPNTEPWGTPDVTEHSSDVKPSTTTRWVRSARNDSIHLTASGWRLQCFSFSNSFRWETLSKALLKLSTATSAWECRFKILARSWVVMCSWVSEDRLLRKPCWRSSRILFASRCFMVSDTITLERSLE